MNKIRTAVVGVGYLGKFHAEKLAALPHSRLIAVCDTNPQQCQHIAGQFKVQAVHDYRELIGQVDAVSIVVPTSIHYEVAKLFLENKIHVLLEKPITTTVAQAEHLIRIANESQVVFQIGHLERFNSVINAVGKILDGPQFIESIRTAPFKLRATDVNVILDVMIHDIDIIQNIVASPITSIQANGASVLTDQIDIANARIQFANGCVANVTASRVSVKMQRILRIFQHNAYFAVDLQDKTLAIHRKGEGEMFPGIPEIIRDEQQFEANDALKDEIAAFLHSITHNTPPIVSGEDGKRALVTAMEIVNIVGKQPFIKMGDKKPLPITE